VVAAIIFLALATTPASWATDDQGPSVRNPASYFSDVAALVHPGEENEGGSELYTPLGQAAVALLTAEADPNTSIDGQPVVGRLEAALQSVIETTGPFPARPRVAAIHLGKRDGTSEDLIVFGLDTIRNVSLVAIHRVGKNYTVLPSTALPRSIFNSVSALDVTGDGIKEVIASADNCSVAVAIDVSVLRWVGGGDPFRVIFSMQYGGDGPCDYRFVPTGRGQDIEVTLPVIGAFDLSRIGHTAKRSRWTYDAGTDRFLRRGDWTEPPKTAGQQLNAAEALLRHGDLPGAVRAYHRAWSDRSLGEHDEIFPDTIDARAFARFREGELLAILGREEDARTALHDAETRGGQLGALAHAFLSRYSGPDGAVHAWLGCRTNAIGGNTSASRGCRTTRRPASPGCPPTSSTWDNRSPRT
jgi:hypothetical protein